MLSVLTSVSSSIKAWHRLTTTLLLSIILCNSAQAGGIFTHYLMGKKAVERLKNQALKELLEQNHEAFQNGMIFADAGYLVGSFGEAAHWGEFLNPYIRHIRTTCPELTATEQCRKLFTHYVGMVGHSLSDVNFDRYFVTEVSRQNYAGDIEAAQTDTDRFLDILIYIENFQEFAPLQEWAPYETLATIYQQAGQPTPIEMMKRGVNLQQGLRTLAMYATGYGNAKVEPISPWGIKNYHSARGGVDDTAQVLASHFDQIWTILSSKVTVGQVPKLVYQGNWPAVDFWIEPQA